MALHVWLMNAILAQATALKQYWHKREWLEREALVPILFSDGRVGPILYSRVKYAGSYEKTLFNNL